MTEREMPFEPSARAQEMLLRLEEYILGMILFYILAQSLMCKMILYSNDEGRFSISLA